MTVKSWSECRQEMVMPDQRRSGSRDGSWTVIPDQKQASQSRLVVKTSLSLRRSPVEPRLDAVQKYVTGNLHRQLSVLQMAQIAGLGKGHFSRVFRNRTGNTPHAYLVACRLKRAVDLLRSPDMKLNDIALECGFSDQAHFCRLFRRSTGWTPTGWRRHFGQVNSGVN